MDWRMGDAGRSHTLWCGRNHPGQMEAMPWGTGEGGEEVGAGSPDRGARGGGQLSTAAKLATQCAGHASAGPPSLCVDGTRMSIRNRIAPAGSPGKKQVKAEMSTAQSVFPPPPPPALANVVSKNGNTEGTKSGQPGAGDSKDSPD